VPGSRLAVALAGWNDGPDNSISLGQLAVPLMKSMEISSHPCHSEGEKQGWQLNKVKFMGEKYPGLWHGQR